MNIYHKNSFIELLEAYIHIFNLSKGNDSYDTVFYINRCDLHDEIESRLETYKEDDVNGLDNILHNLDKEIDLILGVEYDNKEINKLAKKLKNVILKRLLLKKGGR